MDVCRIAQLAHTINVSVAQIRESLEKQGLPLPSHDENAPSLPSSIAEARTAAIDASTELHYLLTEPIDTIHQVCKRHTRRLYNKLIIRQADKKACVQSIIRFDIAAAIPLGGQISFTDIAANTPLTEQMVGRLIRHAATMHIFHEPEVGFVAHTRASRLLVRSDGYSLAHGTSGSIYDVISEDPERALRFSNAMKVMASRPEFDLTYATETYDWESLDEALVVEVGGAQGHFALALASRYPSLSIMVQDMEKVIDKASAGALKERVRFMTHDLFDPQRVQADVFFFRWIFHNWSDKYCIHIIRAQIPALRRGSRLLIQEALMPEPGSVCPDAERTARSLDIEMAYTFNARERTLSEWKALFREASPSFIFNNAIEPKGSALAILEFAWEGIEQC
ncbi:hypothetical protein PG997_002606 [Apiospora hydei]|uniref:O-methyltransferase n=1 Tax=Apiospora hydei TaxID=1337664 RepID=A0ABR1WWX9_9PEZI